MDLVPILRTDWRVCHQVFRSNSDSWHELEGCDIRLNLTLLFAPVEPVGDDTGFIPLIDLGGVLTEQLVIVKGCLIDFLRVGHAFPLHVLGDVSELELLGTVRKLGNDLGINSSPLLGQERINRGINGCLHGATGWRDLHLATFDELLHGPHLRPDIHRHRNGIDFGECFFQSPLSIAT